MSASYKGASYTHAPHDRRYKETDVDRRLPKDDDDDNDCLVFYVSINIIEVTARRWKTDNQRVLAMKRHSDWC